MADVEVGRNSSDIGESSKIALGITLLTMLGIGICCYVYHFGRSALHREEPQPQDNLNRALIENEHDKETKDNESTHGIEAV